MLKELPVLRKVPAGRPDVPAGRDNQRGHTGGGGHPAVNRSPRNHDVVTGHGADRSVDGLEVRGAVLQINSFIADRIAVKLRGSVRGGKRNLHVVIGEQELAAQHQVTAPGQVSGAYM